MTIVLLHNLTWQHGELASEHMHTQQLVNSKGGQEPGIPVHIGLVLDAVLAPSLDGLINVVGLLPRLLLSLRSQCHHFIRESNTELDRALLLTLPICM